MNTSGAEICISRTDAGKVHEDQPLLGQIFQYWDALTVLSEEGSSKKKRRTTRRKDGKPWSPSVPQVQRLLFGSDDQGYLRRTYSSHFLAKGNRLYVKGAKRLREIGDDALNILRAKGLSGDGLDWTLKELTNIADMDAEFVRRKVLACGDTIGFCLRFDTLLWEEYFSQLPRENWSSRFKRYIEQKEGQLQTSEVQKAAQEDHKEEVFRRTSNIRHTRHNSQNLEQTGIVKRNLSVDKALNTFHKCGQGQNQSSECKTSKDMPSLSVVSLHHLDVPPKILTIKRNENSKSESVMFAEFFALSKANNISVAKRKQYFWASSVCKLIGEKGNDYLCDKASIWLEDWYSDWIEGKCKEDVIIIRALGANPGDRLRLTENDIELMKNGNQLELVSNELIQFIATNCFAWDRTVRENLFWISDLNHIWNIVVNVADNEIDNRSRIFYQGLWDKCLAIIPIQHGDGLWSVAAIINLNTIQGFIHSGPFPATNSRACVRYFGPHREAGILQKRMTSILIQTLPDRKRHLDEKYRANISLVVDEKIMRGFDIGTCPDGLEGNICNILRIIYVLLGDMEVWNSLIESENDLYFSLERVCASYMFRVAKVGISAAKRLSEIGLVLEPCQSSSALLLSELEEKDALEACGVDLNSIFSRQGVDHALRYKEEEVRKLEDIVCSQSDEIRKLRALLEDTDEIYIQSMKEKGRLYSSDQGSKMLLRELQESTDILDKKDGEIMALKKKIDVLVGERSKMHRNKI